MSYHSLFEGVCFVQSYSTHIWNAYAAGNLLETKNAKNEAWETFTLTFIYLPDFRISLELVCGF